MSEPVPCSRPCFLKPEHVLKEDVREKCAEFSASRSRQRTDQSGRGPKQKLVNMRVACDADARGSIPRPVECSYASYRLCLKLISDSSVSYLAPSKFISRQEEL